MDYTINRMIPDTGIDAVEARAHHAIGIEPRARAIPPCNVILRKIVGGVDVSAIDPVASRQAIENAGLTAVAGEVRDLMAKSVAAV